jgi:hypothetical protein
MGLALERHEFSPWKGMSFRLGKAGVVAVSVVGMSLAFDRHEFSLE